MRNLKEINSQVFFNYFLMAWPEIRSSWGREMVKGNRMERSEKTKLVFIMFGMKGQRVAK